MKTKNDFIKGHFVHVPNDLTTDPFDMRGEIGLVDHTNYKEQISTVLFRDGTVGEYQLSALEILYPLNALLYRFQMRYAEMKYNEIETVKRIIESSRQNHHDWALRIACFDEVIKGLCVTDCETFHEMNLDIDRHLGIAKRMPKEEKSTLLGRAVRISEFGNYRPGELGITVSVDTNSSKATILLKDAGLWTYNFECLQTLYPLNVLVSRYQKRQRELTKAERKSVRNIISCIMTKKHLWALEIAISKSVISDICLTDLKNLHSLRRDIAEKLSFRKNSL
ncbi:hypothetical protein FXV77_05150 [Sphingobacterium phlebotomi]|uniref:Uncharacterized protein n=1 Tax=Sphingobacterium phlebotomi TaxID=2605433 RepID=A0A5D4HCY3_9SPHI|nr:hypothetical protein [Sphingobacterium phlebotomi]TYR37395.1 hypothetical protein FXV77_05150 [Sphingobacterium phlebotomi]